MSERLRKAYLHKEQMRILAIVAEINREHIARMQAAGEAFYARREREVDEGLPAFSLTGNPNIGQVQLKLDL